MNVDFNVSPLYYDTIIEYKPDDYVMIYVNEEPLPDNLKEMIERTIDFSRELYSVLKSFELNSIGYRYKYFYSRFYVNKGELVISLSGTDKIVLDFNEMKLKRIILEYYDFGKLISYLSDVLMVFSMMIHYRDKLYPQFEEYVKNVVKNIDYLGKETRSCINDYFVLYDNVVIKSNDLLESINFKKQLGSIDWNNKEFIPILLINGELNGIYNRYEFIHIDRLPYLVHFYNKEKLNEMLDNLIKLCSTNENITCDIDKLNDKREIMNKNLDNVETVMKIIKEIKSE